MAGDRSERIAENIIHLVRLFYIMRFRDKGVKPPAHDPGCWALWMLLHEDLPISELGRRLDRSKPSMTALVDKLIARGMARRSPDPDDRRVVMIAITPKGRKFMDGKKAEVKESIKRNLSALDQRQIERLCGSLEEVSSIVTILK